jgi:hypothetical protein
MPCASRAARRSCPALRPFEAPSWGPSLESVIESTLFVQQGFGCVREAVAQLGSQLLHLIVRPNFLSMRMASHSVWDVTSSSTAFTRRM